LLLSVNTVLWRRLDQPGHEAARLVCHAPFWQLGGTAVFTHGGRPSRLEYQVVCDSGWRTLHARVAGWYGDERIRVELVSDSRHRWMVNGRESPAVTGCLDIDFDFSPATNTIPIRRLSLAQGDRADVRAAWLRFPDFTLEPLLHSFRRTDERSYHYEAHDGGFVSELEVSPAGFVLRYPPLWVAEGHA
jgi:hypothetical protein